jgi:hypothetical protein
MLLSVQGNKILSKMWDSFRISYAEKNPGTNMNDAERSFLHIILGGLVHHSDMDAYAVQSDELKETSSLIEEIR